jgi:hypothetical protein
LRKKPANPVNAQPVAPLPDEMPPKEDNKCECCDLSKVVHVDHSHKGKALGALVCEKCGLTSDAEQSVRLRYDCNKVYCNDCHNLSTGRHLSQIEKINKLGYWIGMGVNELIKYGKITSPIPIHIPRSNDIVVNLYQYASFIYSGNEVLILSSQSLTQKPIFIFYKHPAQSDVEFICEMYMAMGFWPKPTPRTPSKKYIDWNK